MKRTLFLLFIIIFVFPSSGKGKMIIPVAILQDTLESYNELLSLTKKQPYLLDEFPKSKLNRDLADVIIAQKAIRLGGIEPEFDFFNLSQTADEPQKIWQMVWWSSTPIN